MKISAKEVTINVYSEIIEMLELSQKFAEKNNKYSVEYMNGYQDSFTTIIDYLYEVIDELDSRTDI
jgi:hypothetical protein